MGRFGVLLHPHGSPISLAKLERVFVQLREHAGIRRPVSDRWQPRLMTCGHAFAVHRVIAWYREGANVQACLPLLATYLGHINISGTQTYLTMTAELLGEASLRFDRMPPLGQEQYHALTAICSDPSFGASFSRRSLRIAT